MLEPGRYESSIRPGYALNSEDPVTDVIQIQLYVTSVLEINQQLLSMTIQGYFRTWWHDWRLEFNSTDMGAGAAHNVL
ncbi:hypothetical protein CYMTET_18143 [Cymbomonas tetramitiformis]|uniref:Neurotransmitter-gated ion-channel ligand-binding domain-containing protein n=1 Tax=Cymbomonas tetramitiformis TaxID=36881 RepID=A0AAE0G8W2_9CHLO|nr:hypothetical protein CYMTET_18143 [Cymbomonas tetramitiformis]